MGKLIFHVDLDAFFASVEALDNPALSGKPLVVGAAPGRRGVVATCSYEARKFGIHSAMPISEAYRRCPNAVFLPVRMGRYAQMSKKVMEILASFTPEFFQVSIDEAYLDLSGTQRLWGGASETAEKIKAALRSGTKLSVSIGAASNRYVAKIASGLKKPDGFTLVPEGEEKSFMRSLPLDKLWGAGESTRARLGEIGIFTVEALQDADIVLLNRKFGEQGANFLRSASLGADPGIFGSERAEKSMSAERTFERDTTDSNEVFTCLRRLTDEISQRLLGREESASIIFIKLRYSNFETLTRRKSSKVPLLYSDELFEAAKGLVLANWDVARSIRLVGFGVAGISGRGGPASNELFSERPGKSAAAEKAIFDIVHAGKGKVTRARFLDPPNSFPQIRK